MSQKFPYLCHIHQIKNQNKPIQQLMISYMIQKLTISSSADSVFCGRDGLNLIFICLSLNYVHIF